MKEIVTSAVPVETNSIVAVTGAKPADDINVAEPTGADWSEYTSEVHPPTAWDWAFLISVISVLVICLGLFCWLGGIRVIKELAFSSPRHARYRKVDDLEN